MFTATRRTGGQDSVLLTASLTPQRHFSGLFHGCRRNTLILGSNQFAKGLKQSQAQIPSLRHAEGLDSVELTGYRTPQTHLVTETMPSLPVLTL